uniref:Uncharacterized protein n=1 Tax=Davidia involucrata TaxID=16924 RepID=A0A5B7C2U7_DAVIN
MQGDIDLQGHAEVLLVSLDPSEAIANKIPVLLPKKQFAFEIFKGKNQVTACQGTNPNKEGGCVLDASYALSFHNMNQEAKKEGLLYHSQQLAITHDLIVIGTPAEAHQQPFNLWCHNVMNIMSKIVTRELIARHN